MEESVILLSEALVPGVGPMLTALSAARQLYASMQESNALCDSVQKRLDMFWHTLLEMERHHTLPQNFKIADFTDIVQRFHMLVLKQAQKNLLVRVGTTPSFMDKLRECHDELDHLGESLRLHAVDEMSQWRATWQRDVNSMTEEITLLAASGNATRMAIGGVPESIEALATLVHEQQKLPNQTQLVEALQAICFQLARAKKLTLPSSMPSWFFTFDDIDVETKPFRTPSTSPAMGTVHRGTWGVHTPVIVKRIALAPQKKPSSNVTWKEADVWWKLNHPNVLRMYGASHVTQPAFIVCEEARHGNIREYLASDPHNLVRFWRLQLDVAVGLSHLRAHNVVHGNLKPSNILIGDDGRAKITDFGFSFIRNTDEPDENDTMMTDDSELSSAVVAPYDSSRAAPELRAAAQRGTAIVSSFASDVFAFAVCMVELLTHEASWNGRQFVSKNTLEVQRPRNISDEAWDLIHHMKRLAVTRVAASARPPNLGDLFLS